MNQIDNAHQDPSPHIARALQFTDNAVEAGHDFPPAHYRQLSSEMQHRAGQEYLLPLHKFTGNEVVLDLGCGDGSFLEKHIRPKVARATGVDVSADFIKLARADKTDVEYLVGDARRVAEVILANPERPVDAPKEFDLVTSNFVCHWLRDPNTGDWKTALQDTFRGVKAILKPGGEMILLFSGLEGYPELFRAAYHVMQAPVWKNYFDEGKFRHFLMPDPEGVERILLESGFDVSQCALRSVGQPLPSEWFLARWFSTMIRPIMSRLPQDDPKLSLQFGEAVAKEYVASAGTTAIRHQMIVVAARSPLV